MLSFVSLYLIFFKWNRKNILTMTKARNSQERYSQLLELLHADKLRLYWNLDYIKSNSIKEKHLGNKKLHLNKKGNTVFANNLLKYLRAAFWNVDFANCFLESKVEYKFKTLNESSSHSSFSTPKSVRRKNLSRSSFAHLNIHCLRNKFDTLVDQIRGNVDILVISETKLGESFLVGQFKIPGFTTPFRRDRNEHGGGIMAFVREDISSKLIL